MKKWILVVALLAFASSADAGMKIKAGSPSSPLAPNIVLGWAYNPADNSNHAILTANLSGIGFGSLPCFFGGVGIAGAGLDSGFSDLTFAMSVPLATCYVKSVAFQLGWEKPIATQSAQPVDVLGNHTWYFGVGVAFGANPSARAKVWSGKNNPKKAMLNRETEVARLLDLQENAARRAE